MGVLDRLVPTKTPRSYLKTSNPGQIPNPEPTHWGTDLWDNDHPASFDYAGKYSSIMYNERVQGLLSKHDPDTPLFLYLAPQDAHGPAWARGFVGRTVFPWVPVGLAYRN